MAEWGVTEERLKVVFPSDWSMLSVSETQMYLFKMKANNLFLHIFDRRLIVRVYVCVWVAKIPQRTCGLLTPSNQDTG